MNDTTTATVVHALKLALTILAREDESSSTYGFYSGGDPRRFHPSEEECSPEEIANHKAACEAWARGERPDIRKACEPNREAVTYTDRGTGKTETIEPGTALALYAPFGIGIQDWTEAADEAREAVRHALQEVAPDVLAEFDRAGLIEGAIPPA